MLTFPFHRIHSLQSAVSFGFFFFHQSKKVSRGNDTTTDDRNRYVCLRSNYFPEKIKTRDTDVDGPISVLLVAVWSSLPFANGDRSIQSSVASDNCQVTPVIHVLQYPGCVPKPIPSFACAGRCSSYLQVVIFFFFFFIYV